MTGWSPGSSPQSTEWRLEVVRRSHRASSGQCRAGHRWHQQTLGRDRTFSSHLSIFLPQKPDTVTSLLCVRCITKVQLWDSQPRGVHAV